MSTTHVSGRGLAKVLGVNESAVRKAVEAGRIKRESDGRFDFAACRSAWGSTTDPARSRVHNGAHSGGAQSVGAHLRTPRSAPLPPADTAALWAVLAYLVDLIPWAVVEHGGGLQLAFDTWSDAMLDLPAELKRRGFDGPAPDFGTVDWDALADAHGLPPIGPHALAADYARRRAEG